REGFQMTLKEIGQRAKVFDLEDPLEAVVLALTYHARELYCLDEMGEPIHIMTKGDVIDFLVKKLSE
ncbi:hypothetical protein HMI55_002361, partial [Coelomomyces lativittatus]